MHTHAAKFLVANMLTSWLLVLQITIFIEEVYTLSTFSFPLANVLAHLFLFELQTHKKKLPQQEEVITMPGRYSRMCSEIAWPNMTTNISVNTVHCYLLAERINKLVGATISHCSQSCRLPLYFNAHNAWVVTHSVTLDRLRLYPLTLTSKTITFLAAVHFLL